MQAFIAAFHWVTFPFVDGVLGFQKPREAPHVYKIVMLRLLRKKGMKMISVILNRTNVVIWDIPYLTMQGRDLIDDGDQKSNSGRFT